MDKDLVLYFSTRRDLRCTISEYDNHPSCVNSRHLRNIKEKATLVDVINKYDGTGFHIFTIYHEGNRLNFDSDDLEKIREILGGETNDSRLTQIEKRLAGIERMLEQLLDAR